MNFWRDFTKLMFIVLSLLIISRCSNVDNTKANSSADGTQDSSAVASNNTAINNCNQFPLHPPKASSFKIIPKNLLLNPTVAETTIDYVVNQKILPALDKAGYEYSFYCMKDSGIAIVTKLEKINEDGTPDLKARYLSGDRNESFSDYLLSLVRAKPGYYRVIVFIVSPYSIIQSKRELTKQASDSLYSEGSDRPYAYILPFHFSNNYQCTALIYQYKKSNQVDNAKEVIPSSLTCIQHLTKAGIWSNLLK